MLGALPVYPEPPMTSPLPRSLRALGAAAALGLLAPACASTAARPDAPAAGHRTPDQAGGNAAPAAPREITRLESAKPPPAAPRPAAEVFVHRDSGFSFPSEVAELRRGDITNFDDQGLDVGIGYGRPGLNVTCFVFPRRTMAEPTVDAHFDGALAAIRTNNPDAVLVDRLTHPVQKGEATVAARLALLELREEDERLGSILLVVPAGDHVIKLRATYLMAAGATSYVLSRLDALLDAVSWAPTGRASAHL